MQFSILMNRSAVALTLTLVACSLDPVPGPCDGDTACTRVGLTQDPEPDAGMPVEKFADGATCATDGECASAHCEGKVCCSGGNCCRAATDCPGGSNNGVGMACDNTATCQGTRGMMTCESFRCVAVNGVPDDTACGSTMEANNCGAYRSVFCNGTANQTAPTCATSCRSNSDCDAGAYCSGGRCMADAANGAACSEDSQCASGHCANGACCASGECCRAATDCPASFSSAAVCDSTSTCQGSREAAACVNNTCSTMQVEDDSACTTSIRAMVCGLGLDVFCTGAVTQSEPTCGTLCVSDAQCASSAHCSSGMCVADVPNGGACDDDGDCSSGHCQNSVCCGSGSCCQTASDCSAMTQRTCDRPEQCQGYRLEAVCTSFQCVMSSARIDDDSACGTSQRNGCGDYADLTCDGTADQDTCLTSCSNSADCDAGLVCSANVCVAPPPVGG